MSKKTEERERIAGYICIFGGLTIMFLFSMLYGCDQLISSCVGFIVMIIGITLVTFAWIDMGGRLLFGEIKDKERVKKIEAKKESWMSKHWFTLLLILASSAIGLSLSLIFHIILKLEGVI